MVKVECDGCKAPYQIDEKRIPPTGLKMRCPKCGTNILVTKPAGDHDLPAVAAPKAPPAAPPRAPARPPPPPRAKAAPVAEEAAWDVEPVPEAPKARSGFGEIDLMVDLPAPAQPEAPAEHVDLPSVPRGTRSPTLLGGVAPAPGRPPPPPPPRGAPPRAAPPAAGAPFGEIDLPAVHPGASPFGVVDLPAVPSAPPPSGGFGGGFGEIDLPSTASAPPPQAPPPPPARPIRGRTVNFGDIDLPAVPEGMDLPQPQRGRGPTVNFGEIDLPLAVEEGLPSPQANVGLPMPAFGQIGLPMAASGAGLPMPAPGAGLPMAAPGAGLPMAAPGAGLPMAAPGAGLPMTAQTGLPMAAQGGGLPMAVSGGGLPMAAYGGGLPSPAPGGGLPMPAMGTGYPMPAGDGLPMHVPGGGLPSPVGEEISLDGPPRSRANAFDDSDRAVPGQMDEVGGLGSVGIDIDGPARPVVVGDEADLSAAPPVPPPGEGQAVRRAAREAEKPKGFQIRQVGIAAAVLVALAGGAMSLVPSLGPFGTHLISDQINAKGNTAALDELRKAVTAKLDEDTAASVSSALEQCRAKQREVPRFAPTKAYCAYVAGDRGLRFGRLAEDEAYAKQLLKEGGAEAGGPTPTLAQAALDALAGGAGKARAALSPLAASNVDAAVMLGNVELASGDAVAAWKRALELKKSPRVSYGLARAYAAAGKNKEAVEAGRAAIKDSPKHAGARILVASLIWREIGKEDAAVALLKEVTDQGKAAGDAEQVAAYTLLGNIHLAKSRITLAEGAFAAALKIDPLAVPALVGNAELFYRSGRFSEALSRFENAAKADAESIPAKVGQAKTMIALERMKEAKDMLRKLREQKPAEPLVTLWLGRADEVLGNKKDAENAYIEAIKQGANKPEVVDAYVALSHLLSQIGRTEDATAKLAEASKKFPDSPALHRAKGDVALALGRYEEAKSEFEAALAKEEDLGSRFRLGQALRRMRKFEEAGAMFDKVAEIDKDYPGLALERGLLFQETGQSDKALEYYSAALKKAPTDVDLKLRVASTQVIAGHAKEAIKMLEEVRKERPNSAEANHFLGRALLVRGTNLAEAMRYLELAANIDSHRAEYHLYVGWAANELNQPAKALPALNRAIELDNEAGDAYWQRGVLEQRNGATTDALKDLQTALSKRSSRFEAYATIAYCFQDLQKWPDAEAAWRKAIEGNDDVAEWHYRLGKLLSGHGKGPASIPELERAVEIAEKGDSGTPAWLWDAHLMLGNAYKPQAPNKQKAIEHFKRFLELTGPQNAYYSEVQTALGALGARL